MQEELAAIRAAQREQAEELSRFHAEFTRGPAEDRREARLSAMVATVSKLHGGNATYYTKSYYLNGQADGEWLDTEAASS